MGSYVWMNLMSADAGILSTTVMDGGQPLDGYALRRDLTALARSSGGDKAALRKASLAIIRTGFLAARERIKAGMESGVSPGLSVSRALSALQDTTIQIACIGGAIALMGFMITIRTGDWTDMLRAVGVSAIVLFYGFPFRSAWERLVRQLGQDD